MMERNKTATKNLAPLFSMVRTRIPRDVGIVVGVSVVLSIIALIGLAATLPA
jgi:tetrahydromethanopterin S-methyltransferase subunit G